LTIPRLGVSVPVVGVPLVAGEWDTSWLNHQAGWLEGTAYPTWLGNSAVAAHVYDAYGQPGPFVNLNHLSYNDEVRLIAWGEMYIYRVRENRLVLPGDLTVLEEDGYAWLTLVTCQGYQPDSGEYRYRRVVRAVLVEVRPVR
jgi:LPXTG-site transpeptidase (sortase) family protein